MQFSNLLLGTPKKHSNRKNKTAIRFTKHNFKLVQHVKIQCSTTYRNHTLLYLCINTYALHLQEPVRENHTSVIQDGIKKKESIMYSSHIKRFQEIPIAVFSSNSSICKDCNSNICYYILAFLPQMECLPITSSSLNQVNYIFLTIYIQLLYNLYTIKFR